MQLPRNLYKILRTVCQLSIVICQLSILSCTQADIQYRDLKRGLVIIRPDIPAEGTSFTHMYHFYPADGSAPITAPCDGQGNFSGLLPAGTYQVIGANTNASGAEFRGMDSYETGTAHATCLKGLTRRLPPTLSGVVDAPSLYQIERTVLTNLVVAGNDTIERDPVPAYLTHNVKFTFYLDEHLTPLVSHIAGTLRGVYPSVNLYYQRTLDDAIALSPDISLDFTPHEEPDHWAASLSLFGICDPKYGEAYRNILSIILTLPDEEAHIRIDLTNELSKIIVENDGHIPIEIPLEFELNWTGIEVVGIVKPWKDGGEGQEPV